MSNDKQPEIRFPGFADDWEERKLGDVINGMYNGQTPSRANKSNWDGNINWLTSGELNRGTVTRTIEKITPEGQKDALLKTVPSGTFVMAITGLEAAGTRGNCAKLAMDTTLNQSCMALYPNVDLLDSNFLFQWYRKIGEDYGLRYTQGTKQQSYNAELIKILPITLPKTDEQKKIAKFLDNHDDTIALHQRQLDLLKETKKGFLQKMFPKNGVSVPEIRFPGFTEDWEQRKLGEIVRISSGFTGDSSLNTGQYELTRIETIATGQVNLNKVGYSNTEPDKKYLLDKGDILFSNINSLSHIGKIALFDLDMKLYHGINLLRLQPMNVNSQFLYQSFQLNNHLEWAKSHANQAVSQASINQTELSKQVFLVPSQQEQQKIGTFFKQLDDTITLHQRKLDLLKETKKGFLQKMFV